MPSPGSGTREPLLPKQEIKLLRHVHNLTPEESVYKLVCTETLGRTTAGSSDFPVQQSRANVVPKLDV